MSIISKETFEKFTADEKKEVRKLYSDLLKAIQGESIGSDAHLALSMMQDRYISLFGKDNLQSKLTYEDVAKVLFIGRDCYYTDFGGAIRKTEADYKDYQSAGYCTSQKQAEKLLAINKLLNVAKFLNKDWKPDEIDGKLWTIGIEKYSKTIIPVEVGAYDFRTEIVYFRTEDLTKQAVAILGEDTMRLALTNDW